MKKKNEEYDAELKELENSKDIIILINVEQFAKIHKNQEEI